MFLFLLRTLVLSAIAAGVLFASAGRWDLPFFWALLGTWCILGVAGMFAVDPDLQRQRLGELRTGGKDRLPMLLIVPLCFVAQLVVAGLDVGRYHWSEMPLGVQLAGLAGSAVGGGLTLWAMAVNRFFVGTVRIQSERGHHLITSGAYQFVRHPGYLGALVVFLCTSLALGSWLSLAPVVPIAVMVLRRTALEDRFLRDELDGYAAYADNVPYRLAPGIW